MSHPPPNSKVLPFRRAKMVVKCTSARQFTGKRTIGELLLLRDAGAIVGQGGRSSEKGTCTGYDVIMTS